MDASRPAVSGFRSHIARAAVLAIALAGIGTVAHAQVGMAAGVGGPGYYGQIQIGAAPQPPQLIYGTPMIVRRDPRYAGPPLYLHVPPGYERHWERHCREFRACGRPVYFVRDDWYRRVYVPRHRHWDEMHHRDEMRRHGDRWRHDGGDGYRDGRGD